MSDSSTSDPLKILCLTEELETAFNLIELGFGELQEIRMDNDFYHLPHLLLASGLERLMKCYICLVYEARNGYFPNKKFLQSLGHDLLRLKETITDDYYATNGIPILCEDFEFLTTDDLLERIIHILSEFGQKARYYNLDVVSGAPTPPIDPRSAWDSLESALESPLPYISSHSMEALYRDYYPRVNAKIIAKLERLLRAIALQFTLGRHGGKLLQLSGTIGRFTALKEVDFGTTDYRRSVKYLQQSKDKWSKRSRAEVLSSPWPTKVISRAQYDGDWPFRFDEVILECREGLFCVINIQGYDFALNGTAKGRLGYPFPHDADMAIIGKSVGPFIQMALRLSSSGVAGEQA